MKYALIIENEVMQVQPNSQAGFISVSDEVIPGMVYDGEEFLIPEAPTKNYTVASKLKLKRRLDELGVWASLRAVMVQDQDVWDEWLLAQDIDIDDPLVNAMRLQMEWTTQQVQDLFNSVN